jgi:hypothetical protein
VNLRARKPMSKVRVWLGVSLMLCAPVAAMVSGSVAQASIVNTTDEPSDTTPIEVTSGDALTTTSTADLQPVDVIEVSGLLDEINADFISSSLERAEKDGSQAVILQLNSRGSVLERAQMEDLLRDVKNSCCNLGGTEWFARIWSTRTTTRGCRRDGDGTRRARWTYRLGVAGRWRTHHIRRS